MKKYYFDFCGTLIKEQTHQQLKYFCREKKYYAYFVKYLLPKSKKLKFDCFYLWLFGLHEEFSTWLLSNSTPAYSLKILDRFVKLGLPIMVITLSDRVVVERYLYKYLGGIKIYVAGSTAGTIFTASMKAEIIEKESEAVFFTDSMMDLPGMLVASTVVVSEFSTPELRVYADKNNYMCVINYA
jgi:hypothetical protein